MGEFICMEQKCEKKLNSIFFGFGVPTHTLT